MHFLFVLCIFCLFHVFSVCFMYFLFVLCIFCLFYVFDKRQSTECCGVTSMTPGEVYGKVITAKEEFKFRFFVLKIYQKKQNVREIDVWNEVPCKPCKSNVLQFIYEKDRLRNAWIDRQTRAKNNLERINRLGALFARLQLLFAHNNNPWSYQGACNIVWNPFCPN